MDGKLMNKIAWVEGLRFIAILMVIVPHFIACFCPQVFEIWTTYNWALCGINGKHGVAIFCVLAGYFASKPTQTTLPEYVVRRYIQFTFNVLFVTLCYVLICNTLNISVLCSMWGGVKSSLFFRSDIIPTYWCLKDLLFGSIMCYLLGNHCKLVNKYLESALMGFMIFWLYKMGWVWIAICLLGAFFRVVELNHNLQEAWKIVSIIIAIVLIPILYRHSESSLTYLMQGLSCCLFIYVMDNVPVIPKILGGKILTFLGGLSFYLFLVHTPVNYILRDIGLSNINMWVLFMISFCISLLLSCGLYFLNQYVLKKYLLKIILI